MEKNVSDSEVSQLECSRKIGILKRKMGRIKVCSIQEEYSKEDQLHHQMVYHLVSQCLVAED